MTEEILYGGDYNPDQWLDRPDVLKEDIRLMKKAGVTVVSLGIFAWSALEPEEGVFTFEWMDRVIEELHGAGVKVFLATPSGARPVWMARKYPEVLRVNASGQRNLFGARHNHCFSSPVYREKTALMNKKLAERYGNHPAVILWHISNEYSGDCHCDLCQANFRLWLKKRYGTINALNKAWWNSFWAHTLSDWEEIHSPVPRGEMTVHGLNIDWKRFTTDMTLDFMKEEVLALREAGSDLPVTTNMMAAVETPDNDPGLDYWKFRDVQDVASWDSYPAWHSPGYKAYDFVQKGGPEAEDYRRASEVAFMHDLFRSLHHKPFLLMESTPSKVNWKPLSVNKRPGMNILSSLQAVAHGADSVQYFQWRQGRGSFEKFHGAVIDQSGRDDTAVFKEAARLGELLKNARAVAGSAYKAEAAIVYNWENRWALEDSQGPVNTPGKGYLEAVRKHYYSLWNRGVPMDIISGEEESLPYKLIVAPMLYMVPRETVQRLEAFVKAGGILVTTYLTGYTDESDLCHEGGAPGPLGAVLGLRVEDLDGFPPHEELTSGLTGAADTIDYVEHVHLESAECLSRFSGYPHEGWPSVSRNCYGKGEAYHLAGRFSVESLNRFYGDNLKVWNVEDTNRFLTKSSGTVNVQVRSSRDGDYLFLMNWSSEPASVELIDTWTDGESGKEGRKWELEGWGSRLLTSKK